MKTSLYLTLLIAHSTQALAQVSGHSVPKPDLNWTTDPVLQRCSEKAIQSAGLGKNLAGKQFGLTLVDLSEDKMSPRVAHHNERTTHYAASITKSLVALSALVLREDLRNGLQLHAKVNSSQIFQSKKIGSTVQLIGEFLPDFEFHLRKMIKHSNNESATYLINRITPEVIDEISVSMGLYDRNHGGGLWIGRPYGYGPGYFSDPVGGYVHAASPLALAKLFTGMAQKSFFGQTQASEDLLSVFQNSAINNRFKATLDAKRPGSELYRKTGTYIASVGTWAHESAYVQRGNIHYVASAMCVGANCDSGLKSLIVKLDDCVVAQNK